MQRSIATVSLSGTLPEKLEAIAAAGFDGVEIFENDPETGYALTPERAARLASCDGVCVTASALVNRTLDGLLAAAPPAAWKLLVGPSAPLCREALDLGFAAVCGARVTDVPAVVRVIQEGGCFQQIRRTGGVRLLNLEA